MLTSPPLARRAHTAGRHLALLQARCLPAGWVEGLPGGVAAVPPAPRRAVGAGAAAGAPARGWCPRAAAGAPRALAARVAPREGAGCAREGPRRRRALGNGDWSGGCSLGGAVCNRIPAAAAITTRHPPSPRSRSSPPPPPTCRGAPAGCSAARTRSRRIARARQAPARARWAATRASATRSLGQPPPGGRDRPRRACTRTARRPRAPAWRRRAARRGPRRPSAATACRRCLRVARPRS